MQQNRSLEHLIINFSHYSPPQIQISLSVNGSDYFLKCVITMNILHNSRVNPDLSAYAYLYGPYNFNKSPMATPGTCVIVHNKPGNFKSWIHNSIPGWYIGPLLYHCRCKQFFMPATGIIWITDTLQYIPKAIVPPKTTTEDYLQQAIGDII